jgi:hypothetical protein
MHACFVLSSKIRAETPKEILLLQGKNMDTQRIGKTPLLKAPEGAAQEKCEITPP